MRRALSNDIISYLFGAKPPNLNKIFQIVARFNTLMYLRNLLI